MGGKTFDAFSKRLCDKRIETEQLFQEGQPLGLLEHFVHRLIFKLDPEYGDAVKDTESTAARLLTSLLPKVTNELLGFLWVLRGGSSWAAYGHLRALLELELAVGYLAALTAKRKAAAKRAKRARKYIEYPDAGRLAFIRANDLDEEGRRALEVTPARFDELMQSEPGWIELWELESITDLRRWQILWFLFNMPRWLESGGYGRDESPASG